MTPAIHDMTVIRCVVSRHGVDVHLPTRVVRVIDEDAARRLVRAEACGSVPRWESAPAVPLTEGEMRALFGDR
jgi:hypothetical protein